MVYAGDATDKAAIEAWITKVRRRFYGSDPGFIMGAGSGRGSSRAKCAQVSVVDPDQPDPYVFGPPRSGSITQRYRTVWIRIL